MARIRYVQCQACHSTFTASPLNYSYLHPTASTLHITSRHHPSCPNPHRSFTIFSTPSATSSAINLTSSSKS